MGLLTVRVAANPGRWLQVEGRLEVAGDVVTIAGRPLAALLRELYLGELEHAGDAELELGPVTLTVEAAR